VQTAEQMARVQHPDPDLLPLAEPSLAPTGPFPQRAFDSTRSMGAGERAKVVSKIVDVAKRNQLTTAGICSVTESVEAIFNFGGLSVLDQRSFLNERVGKQLFGENITINDDSHHPLQAGAPFDGEGVGRQRVTLVEKGVIKSLVYARGTAARLRSSPLAEKLGEIRPTGHGFPLPNEMGEAPMNIVFENAPSERKSVREMIASTERGIYVTRLWYIREVEPYEKVLTGMTRDGTFRIENGKLTHGLRNFRFNQSLVEMLSNVEAMSEPVRACGEESFDMVVPAMKVRDFNFTEVTKF